MAHVPRLYRPGRIEPGTITLDGAPARRLRDVMRLRAGEAFLLFSGDGREWSARVTQAGRDSVRGEVDELVRQEPAPTVTLELWCALVRANRFDLVVEKCTEAGVDVIRPLVTEHTVRGDAISAARAERLERIAIEAAEQCGRLTVPVITEPMPLTRALALAKGTLLFADAAGAPWPQAEALLPPAGTVTAAVGPEGGWSEAELAAANASGALLVRLGPNILRTETAAIVLTGLVRAAV